MKNVQRLVIAGLLTGAVVLPTLAHMEKSEPLQSLRQSYFTLVAMSFGPMADMVKGKIEWDAKAFERWAADLAAVSGYRVERGFAPGSEEGKTRAKPEIWLDTEDFNEHLEGFRAAAAKLAEVAQTGDRGAIAEQLGATGRTCKGCHDEYKAKDYLY